MAPHRNLQVASLESKSSRGKRRAVAVWFAGDVALCIATSVLIRPARRAETEGCVRATTIALDAKSEGKSAGRSSVRSRGTSSAIRTQFGLEERLLPIPELSV